jgi:hypothetical protein
MLKFIVFTCLKKQPFKFLLSMIEKSYGYEGKEVVVVQEGPTFVRPSIDECWEVQAKPLTNFTRAHTCIHVQP